MCDATSRTVNLKTSPNTVPSIRLQATLVTTPRRTFALPPPHPLLTTRSTVHAMSDSSFDPRKPLPSPRKDDDLPPPPSYTPEASPPQPSPPSPPPKMTPEPGQDASQFVLAHSDTLSTVESLDPGPSCLTPPSLPSAHSIEQGSMRRQRQQRQRHRQASRPYLSPKPRKTIHS